MSSMKGISIEDGVKNLLKNHLNIKTETVNPCTLFDGSLKVSIFWDNELISESKETIKRSFF